MMEIGKRKTSVGASVNGQGVYMSGHVREINGTEYTFFHTVRTSRRGLIEVYRGNDARPCKTFTGKVRELPGLMHLSARLGKLITF